MRALNILIFASLFGVHHVPPDLFGIQQFAACEARQSRRECLHPAMYARDLAYPSGDFAVVVSEHSASTSLTQQAIVDHARVVSECFRTLTVLPFRFGTIFDSDEALRRLTQWAFPWYNGGRA